MGRIRLAGKFNRSDAVSLEGVGGDAFGQNRIRDDGRDGLRTTAKPHRESEDPRGWEHRFDDGARARAAGRRRGGRRRGARGRRGLRLEGLREVRDHGPEQVHEGRLRRGGIGAERLEPRLNAEGPGDDAKDGGGGAGEVPRILEHHAKGENAELERGERPRGKVQGMGGSHGLTCRVEGS